MTWITLNPSDTHHSDATRRKEQEFSITVKKSTIMEWKARELDLIKLIQHVSVSAYESYFI
jgi:hypothetical protein